jgi:uncharacterized protein DUF4440
MRTVRYSAVGMLWLAMASSVLMAQSLPQDFLKAQSERNAAMRSSDAKVYGRYTLDSFMVVMPDGSMQSKEQRMAIMSKAQQSPNSGAPRDGGPREETQIIAGNTIIVNWIAAIQGKDARFTEVWVKQNGAWKVAGAHVSMIQVKN